MTYTFRQQLLDPKRYMYAHPTTKQTVYKSAYSMTPKYITVHNSYNDASAANEATYHNRTDNHNSTSFHIAIDDKEVVQLLPFDRNGYHAGDGSIVTGGNRTSIGIEICYSKSGGERYTKAEANAVHYIATLLKQYGWGVDLIKQHYDWSRKNCPHRIRDEGRWKSFVQRIQNELNALNKPVTPTFDQTKARDLALNTLSQIEHNTVVDGMFKEIKAAVADGRFSSKHENIHNYDFETLKAYSLIALARRK